MKRIISILFVVVMFTLLLVGCGSQQSAETPPATPPADSEEPATGEEV